MTADFQVPKSRPKIGRRNLSCLPKIPSFPTNNTPALTAGVRFWEEQPCLENRNGSDLRPLGGGSIP